MTTMELKCPVCKTDRYMAPQLELMVSPCYHRVCRTCVDSLFSHGPAPCPVCQTSLRKSNFVIPLFEDLRVEKECRIRQKIASIFNKTEDDFETLKDYNDYLEEVEGIVWNLVDEVDVQATNAKLEAYRIQNRDLIARNTEKEKERVEREKAAQQAEAQQRLEYEMQLLEELEAEERQKEINSRKFIDSLIGNGSGKGPTVRATTGQKRVLEELGKTEMPSMRGLKRDASKSIKENVSPFNPLDTLSFWDIPPSELFEWPNWIFYQTSPAVLYDQLDRCQLMIKAGGVLPEQIFDQTRKAFISAL